MPATNRNIKTNTSRRNPLEDGGGGPGPGGRTTGGGGTRITRTGTPRTSTNTNPPSRRTSSGQRSTMKQQTKLTKKQFYSTDVLPSSRKGKQVLLAHDANSPKRARKDKFSRAVDRVIFNPVKANKKQNTPYKMKNSRVATRNTKRGN